MASEGYSLVVECGLLIPVTPPVAEHGGLGAQASGVVADEGSVFAAPGLWSTGSVAVAHWLCCFAARGIFPDQVSNP